MAVVRMQRAGGVDLPAPEAGQLVAAGLRHVDHVGDQIGHAHRLPVRPVRHAAGQVRCVVGDRDQVIAEVVQVERQRADVGFRSNHAGEPERAVRFLPFRCAVAGQDRRQRLPAGHRVGRVVADAGIARRRVNGRTVGG